MAQNTFAVQGGYSGEAYARGTQALLMKQKLDQEVAELVVKNHPNTEIHVADFGAGVGILERVLRNVAQVAGKRIKYVAVEPSQPQIEELSKIAGGVELSRTAVRRMPMNAPIREVSKALPESGLDAVTMENSLYAITEGLTSDSADQQRAMAVRNAAYTLKPDGILVITDPLNGSFGKPVKREFEIAIASGMNTMQAIMHLAGLLLNKDVAQANKKTRENLIASTKRFDTVEELVAFVTGTGLFEVVEGTVRNDAYIGGSALVAFRRTTKPISMEEIPDTEPVIDPLKIFEGETPDQTMNTKEKHPNPMRYILRGDPKEWPQTFKERFKEFEKKCYAKYDDAEDRIEGDAFIEDFLLNKREAELLDSRHAKVLDIQHRFYAYGDRVKAYLCLVDFELTKEIQWHGITLKPGHYVIPRKIMQDGTVRETIAPYWDDVYAHVAKLFKEERDHVAVVMHMQPMSLLAVAKAQIIDPQFHSLPENWWQQTPKQQKFFSQMNAILGNPVLRYILERVKPEQYKKLVRNRLVIPILPYSHVAFNPDNESRKSGYVVVRFSR